MSCFTRTIKIEALHPFFFCIFVFILVVAAARKIKPGLKENEDPCMVSNRYQAIIIARNSLRQREETSKMQAEIQK